jgi:two-component system, OmpR family, KDP operon response regulator KdpE
VTGAHILLLTDDKSLARLIGRKLRRHGLGLESVATAAWTGNPRQRRRPDLALVDLDAAEDESKWGLITDVRARERVPVIVTSTGSDRDAVAALEMGADDYLRKPFGVDELFARMRVVLRHVAGPGFGAQPVVRVGDLEVDIERRQVLRGGEAIHLTPTEYQLLKLFATHPGRVLPDSLLIEEVWGPAWRGGEHILHVYVARLRSKVEQDPSAPRYLLSASGLGYRFAAGVDGSALPQLFAAAVPSDTKR